MSTNGCCRGLPAKVCIARPYGCSDGPVHRIRFTERTLASVRCECVCGWKCEVMTNEVRNRQQELNTRVAMHLEEHAPS